MWDILTQIISHAINILLHFLGNISGFRKYLQDLSPYLAITLLKLGKLCWFLEKDTLAREYIKEAYRITTVTHGSNSEIMDQCIRPLMMEISTLETKSIELSWLSPTDTGVPF